VTRHRRRPSDSYAAPVRRAATALVTLVLAGLVAAPSANAGTWESHGPNGDFVASLSVAPTDPLRVYAGGPGGVYASVDGGLHWTDVNGGLPLLDVRAVAVDPTQPLTVYAATFGGGLGAGVFKTTDGGQHWNPINTGLTNLAAGGDSCAAGSRRQRRSLGRR